LPHFGHSAPRRCRQAGVCDVRTGMESGLAVARVSRCRHRQGIVAA
jgi:hypothetical protein